MATHFGNFLLVIGLLIAIAGVSAIASALMTRIG